MRVAIVLLLSFLNVLALQLREGSYNKELKSQSWIDFRDYNIIKQQMDFTCGTGSLGTVLRYFYNQEITEAKLMKKVLLLKGINPEDAKSMEYQDEKMGFSFYDLAEVSKEYGFKAVGLAVDFETLQKLNIPVIVYIKVRKYEHFTVFKRMDDKYVYLADPSYGNIQVRHSRFRNMFETTESKLKGKLLAIIPVDKTMATNGEFRTYKNSFDVDKIITQDRFKQLH